MKDYKIEISDTDEQFIEKILIVYATGLAKQDLSSFTNQDLRKRAKSFIQGIMLYNKELEKEVKKNVPI